MISAEENNIEMLDELDLYERWRLQADQGQAPVRVDRFIMDHMGNTSRSRVQKAAEAGIKAAMAHTFGRLEMVSSMGFDSYAGFGMNAVNSGSVEMIEEEISGIKDIMLSFENTFARMNRITSSVPLSALVYGRIPLMITRNCPVREEINCSRCGKRSFLTDRKNEKFPVRCSADTTEIFNSHPLCVFERDDRLREEIGRVFLFTTEPGKEIHAVMKAFDSGENVPGSTRGCYFRRLD